ncbi:MAG: ATP synthase F0 subunit B [Desulfobacteria bacterium]
MVQIAPDWTLFLQIGNFLLLLFLLNLVLYRPIRRILNERKEKIAGFEENIVDLTQKAEKTKKEFADRINDAKAAGFQKKETLKAEGEGEEKQLVGKIQQEILGEMESVRSQIVKDVENVRNTLKKDVDTFSHVIAEKILGRALS